MEATEFILSLKHFIARRGRPELIYPDNGCKSERLNSYLAGLSIKLHFNLSCARWWGDQFERLIGLFKSAFYKTIGNGTLQWGELEKVVFDVKATLNNQTLSYMEDNVQLPLLTCNYMPELKAHHMEEKDLWKRAKHLQ